MTKKCVRANKRQTRRKKKNVKEKSGGRERRADFEPDREEGDIGRQN